PCTSLFHYTTLFRSSIINIWIADEFIMRIGPNPFTTNGMDFITFGEGIDDSIFTYFKPGPIQKHRQRCCLTTGRQIGVLNKGWDVWDFIGLIFHKTPPYENSVLTISITYVSHESMINLNKSSKAILIQKPKIT